MKLIADNMDDDDPGSPEFVKIAGRRRALKGKQNVNRLVLDEADTPDPFTRFDHPDLNDLCRAGFLEELLAGIKTGKEASVYLGRNADGLVAVKLYTDLRVRSFKRDASYRQGWYLGDFRLEKAISHGSRKGMDARQQLWVREEFS